MLLNNTGWHMPVTEQPVIDTTEIWSLVNVTDDTHPIHLHLVRFRFSIAASSTCSPGAARDVSSSPAARAAGAAEAGWKDTVRAGCRDGDADHHALRGLHRPLHWHCTSRALAITR